MTLPSRRTVGLWAAFTALSLLDVALTLTALSGVPGAREANPLPAWTLATHGEVGFFVLKAASVGGIVLTLWALRGHERAARVMAGGACMLLVVVNGFSVVQLRLAGVI